MRIIHTADWQLGLKLNFLFNPETAARLRSYRFDSVRRLAEIAEARKADLVVVAGDVFDDNALGMDCVQQAADALSRFGGRPVVLISGNHDSGGIDCILRRLPAMPGIHVALERKPITVAGCTILPCPLLKRHELDDPARWIAPRTAEEGIRIVVAHGGVLDFSGETASQNRIDPQALLEKGIDYLAIGDWHGTFRYNDRIWYSGAIEATRFKEADPGNVLQVDISAPGATPVVERIPVARTRWLKIERSLNAIEDVVELKEELARLPDRSDTLLELTLAGVLNLSARDQLETLIRENRETLAFLREDLSSMHTEPSEADIAEMAKEGFVKEALESLRAAGGQAADNAIRLMYRLQQEARREVA